MRRHITSGRLLLASVAVTLVAVFLAFMLPAGSYLFVPDTARPLDGKVQVEGTKEPAGPGDIYYVDVTIRRASWLERLFSFARPDGSTLVPKGDVVPPGSSFSERLHEAQLDMDRSERVAATVALKEAGYKVKAKPAGVLIEGVAPDVPAAKVLADGDVIVTAAGRVVRTPAQLRAALRSVTPGETVAIRVRRSGRHQDLGVRTIADPSQPGHALIGIRVGQAADIRLPLKVKIDLGRVGGPSAGLPFALDVLQRLGRNVDHGYRVAATGELELDGTVYPIGGVKQKTYGVRRAGVDVFLVPAGDNAREARRYAGKVRVIPVESFQQALHALATLPKR